ncbi:UNVERIFIED_CONTAM: putative late blight resistance proteinR1B-8 [Sesamum angustifolium]|uniref:Late blight resistance proteinR1B-8 n=1 Tax=Sesamum angustifolium TaxID=2727405 RepID=A0AAW2LJH5_9LAMI
MADAAVEFLLDNLQQLLIHHAHLISDAKNQVEKLESDLRLFKAFLRDSTKKRRKDDSLRELVRQIRDVVYEAEDIIDALVTQSAESKSKSYFSEAFDTPGKLHSIIKDIEIVSDKVKEIYGDETRIDFANLIVGDGGPAESERPLQRRGEVVGLEDEAEKLVGYLLEETQQLDVISIIGMPGLGKTTLAGKIFSAPVIQYEFPNRIWVYVSQEFTRKDIFLAILREFTRDEDMYHKSDQELALLVSSYLEKGKFLLVMDDVWTAEDWEKLQIALPKSNKMGKVLITSRQVEVGRFANRYRDPHRLRFLTQDESWLLLQMEVFGGPKCPSELEISGRLIADQCDRLPLAIVVVGGMLFQKFSASNGMVATLNAWRKISESVSMYLSEDPRRGMEKIIALSYDELPYHLRACFLYLGMFPEDFEIPVRELIRMWVAEGFIQQKSSVSLEEIAENYLEDLVNRNLVMVDKRKLDGRVKTCRIHDMLRDFCIKEAGNERENFLQEMRRSGDGFEPSIAELQQLRRVCIHSNFLSFITSNPYGPRTRSLCCFLKEEITLLPENVSSIPKAFKLLRVLAVTPVVFTRFPLDLIQLIHLKYIALSSTFKVLPEVLAKLWNLQTLIIHTTSRALKVKADIWQMTQLRYLKTNASITLVIETTGKAEAAKLKTLYNLSPESCTENLCAKARNLKELGIRGRLALFLDSKGSGSCPFDFLGIMEHLENLKLLNDVSLSPPSEWQLNVPPPYKFPRKLRFLTLSFTYFDWGNMSVLGLLENLEVLKLKDNAFVGNYWETTDGGFRRLEVLQIGYTDLICWVASGHHFPRLRRLELRNCEELGEVPLGLAEIPSLQIMDLHRASKSAVHSAKEIQSRKREKGDGFMLSIFPPDL